MPGTTQKPITKPELKPADPGPLPTQEAAVGLWRGTESGNHSVTFMFTNDHKVVARDSYGTWSGTWKMIGQTNVSFELTSPNHIRYSAQIRNGKLTGTARNVTTGATWSINLSLETVQPKTDAQTQPQSAVQPPANNYRVSFRYGNNQLQVDVNFTQEGAVAHARNLRKSPNAYDVRILGPDGKVVPGL